MRNTIASMRVASSAPRNRPATSATRHLRQHARRDEQPQRGEQQDLRRDLRVGVARERDLRDDEREREHRRQREQRPAEAAPREHEEREQRDPAEHLGRVEQPGVALDRVRLGEHDRQQVRELELQRPVLHLVDGERVEADASARARTARRAASPSSEPSRAIQRAGVRVRAAVAVDQDVLRRVSRQFHAVIASDRGDTDRRVHVRARRASTERGFARRARAGRATSTAIQTTAPSGNASAGRYQPFTAKQQTDRAEGQDTRGRGQGDEPQPARGRASPDRRSSASAVRLAAAPP